MAKAFGIQQVTSRRAIAVLIREHAFEDQDFLTFGMIMRRKVRVLLEAYDGGNLTGF